MATILAVDPAKKSGFSIWEDGKLKSSGVVRADDALELEKLVRKAAKSGSPVLVYEVDHFGRAAYHIGLSVGRWFGAWERGVKGGRVVPVKSRDWRKVWGDVPSGRDACKAHSVRWVRERFGIEPKDHNEADSIGIGAWAVANEVA